MEVTNNKLIENQNVTVNIKPKDKDNKPMKLIYLPGLLFTFNRPDNSSENIS